MKKPYFSYEETGIIKGIALIMMFIHHFFTFPSWWLDGIEYPILERIAPYFCSPFKLCVPVFCFLTGYTYFFCKNKTYKYSLKKITDIFISYWGVFLIFAVIASVNGYKYQPLFFIKELFALYRPTMRFCWYVYFYYLFMLLLPLIVKVLSKNIHWDVFIAIIAFPFMLDIILYLLPSGDTISELIGSLSWFPSALVGYIFAEHRLFERIESFNFKYIQSKTLNIILWILVMIIVPMGRYVAPQISIHINYIPIIHVEPTFGISLDVLYAPLFIYSIIRLCRTVKLVAPKKCISEIGKYSLLMWFVSCIFYNNSENIFQPILYAPHNPVLVLLWGLLICYLVSAILDVIFRKLIRIKNRFLFDAV